jgi:FixJ family two-component response regulator
MAAATGSVVYLVEDDADVRDSLRALVASYSVEWRLVEFASAESFLAHFKYSRDVAQCLLLDVGLPGMDGVALQKELQRRQIAVPVIVLTGLLDVPLAVEAVRAGATDVIQKPAPMSRLQSAIRIALENDRASQRRRSEQDDVMARLQLLSRRERDVMVELLGGKIVKEIAADMHIGTQTVLKHRANVLRKMGVRTELELSQLLQALDMIGSSAPLSAGRLPRDTT